MGKEGQEIWAEDDAPARTLALGSQRALAQARSAAGLLTPVAPANRAAEPHHVPRVRQDCKIIGCHAPAAELRLCARHLKLREAGLLGLGAGRGQLVCLVRGCARPPNGLLCEPHTRLWHEGLIALRRPGGGLPFAAVPVARPGRARVLAGGLVLALAVAAPIFVLATGGREPEIAAIRGAAQGAADDPSSALAAAAGPNFERSLSASEETSLVKALDDPSVRARRRSVALLRWATSPEAVAALVEALVDEDAGVRDGARRSLAGLGEKSRAAASELLTRELAEADQARRPDLLVALGSIGREEVAESLLAGLRSREDRALALVGAEAELETLLTMTRASPSGLAALGGTTFDVAGLTAAGGAAEHVGSVSVDVRALPLIGVTVTVSWRGDLGSDSISLATTVLAGS